MNLTIQMQIAEIIDHTSIGEMLHVTQEYNPRYIVDTLKCAQTFSCQATKEVLNWEFAMPTARVYSKSWIRTCLKHNINSQNILISTKKENIENPQSKIVFPLGMQRAELKIQAPFEVGRSLPSFL